mgnify:CR=1 FL=1
MSSTINDAMTIKLDYELPEYPAFEAGIRRAPRRESHLSEADKALAIKNALRYIHPDHHEQMAKEFAQELEEHGRIYVPRASCTASPSRSTRATAPRPRPSRS